MKLKVYQQGGGLIYTPFIPGAQSATASSSSRSSGEDDPKLDPLDKEIIALMKDQNLLPSDIQAIYNSLTTFQRRTQKLSTLGGTSAYRSVMPGMLQIMQMVSVAKNNKERFDKSAQLMTDREAGGELALDSYGAMWVMDNETGKVSKVMPSEFDRQQYTPLSNSQVLDLRRSRPELAFDLNSFETVGNNIIGMKQIQQEIAAVINDFGSRKSDDYEARNFIDLAREVASKGYFKVSTERTRSLDDIEGFTNLLWNTLGNNARNLLTARAVLKGDSPLSYLSDMIFKDADIKVTSDFDSNMTKSAGGAGSDTEKLDDKDTYAERIASGEGVVGHWDYIMPGNSGHPLYMYYQDYGTPMSDGNSMKTMSMERFLENFDASGDINWSKATLGDYKINPEVDLPKIMYKGGSTIKRAYLPVKDDGTVDFKAQQEMATLQNWIDDSSIINEALIKERVSEIKNAYWDENEKVIRFKNEKPFLIVDVVTSSDKVRFSPDSPYMYNMDKGPADLRREYLDRYESVLENGYPEHSKNKDYDFGKTRGRHLYEGLLFLPITHETIGAVVYHHQNVPKTRYEDVAGTAEIKEKKLKLKGNYDG